MADDPLRDTLAALRAESERADREADQAAQRAAKFRRLVELAEEVISDSTPSTNGTAPAAVPDESGTDTPVGAQVAATGKFAGMTMIAAAETVVREAGHALHVQQIMDAMLDEGFIYRGERKKLRTSLVGSMDRKVRREDTFTKPAPATYGLIEWNPNNLFGPAVVGDRAPQTE